MTNTDFSDVLSSIRRLVSKDDENVLSAPKGEADRFVLTPALRVHDEPMPTLGVVRAAGKAVEHKNTATTPKPIMAPKASSELQEQMVILAPLGDAPDDSAADTSETVREADYLVMAAAWKEELARVSERRAQQSLKDAEKPAPETENSALNVTLEARIAELEEAVSHVDEDWEPDGTEPEIARPPRHHIFEVVDNSKFQSTQARDEIRAPSTPDAPAKPTPRAPAQRPETPPDPSPMFAHVEAKPRAPYLLSQPILKAENIEADNVVEQLRDYKNKPAEVIEEDDVFLDVEALRTMINGIVREELRGKMGEDITRNLRRMVRQEIERALLPENPGRRD